MNKQEFVTAVSILGEMTKKDSEKAIVAVFEVITETLAKKEKVSIVDFGTFSVKERAERTGRNPSTKETIIIPAKDAPHFKAGKGLKNIIKGI